MARRKSSAGIRSGAGKEPAKEIPSVAIATRYMERREATRPLPTAREKAWEKGSVDDDATSRPGGAARSPGAAASRPGAVKNVPRPVWLATRPSRASVSYAATTVFRF